MLTVILVAHILVSIVLIGVVLMQRSEGGALGIGGGGGGPGGGLMSGTGVKGALVRTTIIFGAIFFLTSLGLTTISTGRDSGGRTDIERALEQDFAPDPAGDELGIGDINDILDPNLDLLGNDPLARGTPVQPRTPPAETDPGATVQDDPLSPSQ
jgi:preprotein translocase subunit SecG